MKLVYKFLIPTVIVLGLGFYLLIEKTVSSKNEVVDLLQSSSNKLLQEQLEKRQNAELKLQNKFLNFSADSIANLSGNFIDNYDKEGLISELKYYFNIDAIRSISVFDELSNEYFLVISKGNGSFVFDKKIKEGLNGYKIIKKDMLHDKKSIGFVELVYDESKILNEILKTRKNVDTVLANFAKQVEEKKIQSKKEEVNTVIFILIVVLLIISFLSYFVVNRPLYILKNGLDDFFLFLQNKKDNTKKINLISNDEFGAMASSLNDNISVSAKLHEEIYELNTNLEKRIDEKTKKVTTLLNNAGQGFLTFDTNFKVDSEYSKECEKLVSTQMAYKDISDLLFSNNSEKKELFKVTLINALNENEKIKRNAYLSLLPSIILLNKRAIKLEYKILEDNKFMLILTNITSQKKLERKIKKEQEILKMIVSIVSESQMFYDTKNEYIKFVESCSNYIETDKSSSHNISEMYRKIHTFKGSFSQLYMQDVVENLHNIESEISTLQKQISFSNNDLLQLIESFDFKTSFEKSLLIIEEILGKEFLESDNYLKIDLCDITKLQEKIEKVLSHTAHTSPECHDILSQVQRLSSQKLISLLNPYVTSTMQLAKRLEKDIYEFEIIGDSQLSINESFKPFIKSLVHVFRNSVDHGIEIPETRLEKGKDEYGTISCSFEEKNDNLYILISDDGSGIDIERLKSKLLLSNINLEGLEDNEIYSFIFDDNISTKESVSDVSGRGVGMSAVKNEIEKLGGVINVNSQKDIGTSFEFIIPLN